MIKPRYRLARLKEVGVALELIAPYSAAVQGRRDGGQQFVAIIPRKEDPGYRSQIIMHSL